MNDISSFMQEINGTRYWLLGDCSSWWAVGYIGVTFQFLARTTIIFSKSQACRYIYYIVFFYDKSGDKPLQDIDVNTYILGYTCGSLNDLIIMWWQWFFFWYIYVVTMFFFYKICGDNVEFNLYVPLVFLYCVIKKSIFTLSSTHNLFHLNWIKS